MLDDDSVEEIKSTGEDTIDRLIDHMNINKKGNGKKLPEITDPATTAPGQ